MAAETYLIPERNLEELKSRVEKLNKRARKIGVPEIKFFANPDHVRSCLKIPGQGKEERVWVTAEKLAGIVNPQLTGEVMTWWKVEVEGETPRFEGWEFIAVLEPMTTEDGETLNLIQCVPGKECPKGLRDAIGRCDHCKVNRPRKQTFVVQKGEEFKSVGRQCLKDFLGYHADPHQLASWAEMLAELGSLCDSACDDEWLGGSGYRADCWDLEHFLTLTACRVRLFGWLGRGKAYEQGDRRASTADNVLELLTPPNRLYATAEQIREWEAFVAKHVVEDCDKTTAAAAIEWIKAISATEIEKSDYLANCNLVARMGVASRKTVGIGASIIVAYQKAMEQEINRQKQAAKPESNWIGEVGVRIPLLKVTCEKIFRSEGQFGVTGIHKMADENGNDLTWFASEGTDWLAEGETAWVAAGVKKHDTFANRKQTIITRVTIYTDEEAEAIKVKEAKKAERAAKKLAKAAK